MQHSPFIFINYSLQLFSVCGVFGSRQQFFCTRQSDPIRQTIIIKILFNSPDLIVKQTLASRVSFFDNCDPRIISLDFIRIGFDDSLASIYKSGGVLKCFS